ncbi:transient receptor potential cation channel subfamily V member 6-like [Glandiceps talaboti]
MPVDFGADAQCVGGGVNQQSDETAEELYSLASLKGGGLLVDLMRTALRDNNHEEIDAAIKREVPKYLYNEGKETERIPITTLISRRNDERQKNKVKNTKKSHILRSNSVSLHTLTEHHDYGARDVCWHIDKRGTVGETILHICLLNNSRVHNELAKKLVEAYPKLVVDIYLGEEYYGESPLHMALVNEDPDMVNFLMKHEARVNERCCGNFFTPEDQKSSRTCNFEHEWVEVSEKTDYEGLTYWGEYPLAFAACLDQEESFKVLREKGGDPNMKDNNGNTVLHMTVIHNKKNMYDLAFSMGATPNIRNRQGLTPLNLAAKLARKEMFDHILELEREVYWIYGNVTCAAYALNGLDSIHADGEINDKGALHIIVNQIGHENLDMMDGLIVNILKEKWKHYARYRFFRRAAFFILYLVELTIAFYLRPGRDLYPTVQEVNTTINGTSQFVNKTVYNDCYLQYHHTLQNQVRIGFEVGALLGTILFLIYYAKELYFQGWRNFLFTNLRNAPAKAVFLCSLFCILFAIPGRITCEPIYEDIMVILAMLMTCPYFLFFLRPFKLVGPFVVMIYKMIRGDLLRFFAIYLVFLIGFSQGMYLIYIGTDDSLFSHPVNAVLGMFIMSLGEFGDIYKTFNDTRHQNMAKFLFVIYMVLVTLLLINMLIAMMGNTYTMIAETRKEWLRQWAKIVLVIEQAVSPDKRKLMQMKYSQPMQTEGRAIVMRWHHTQEDQEEQRRFKELHDKHSTQKFFARDSGWQDKEDS